VNGRYSGTVFAIAFRMIHFTRAAETYAAPVAGALAATVLSASEPVRVVDGVARSWGATGTRFMAYCAGCEACTTVDGPTRRCRLCF